MQPATQILAHIEHCLTIDQGAKFRELQRETFSQLTDAYDPTDDRLRSHLGASVIGGECTRKIWYAFRWAKESYFEGRILRLFNRGHLEEARFIALLKMCGYTLHTHDANGNQLRINYGHFGGSCDAVIIGLPDIPNGEATLGEFKTHGDKSFNDLTAKGMQKSKPEHFIQMQVYMKGLGLQYGFYLAVNKNTDELYGEIIIAEPRIADEAYNKAHYIVTTLVAPPRINNSPSWYQCKTCDFLDICHYRTPALVTCRTCENSAVTNDGGWVCKMTGEILNKQQQFDACNSYRRII